MVEKMNKINVNDILIEMADKLDLKVSKKEKQNIKPELPKLKKDYESMSSDQLATEIKDIELNIKAIETQNNTIRMQAIAFLNSEQSNACTKRLFEGIKVDERKIVVYDKKLTLMQNLKEYLKSCYEGAIEKELTYKYLKVNPQFADLVEELDISDTPTGAILAIHMNRA